MVVVWVRISSPLHISLLLTPSEIRLFLFITPLLQLTRLHIRINWTSAYSAYTISFAMLSIQILPQTSYMSCRIVNAGQEGI